MAKYIAYRFYWNTIAQGNGGSKGVLCQVKGEVLFYTAEICYSFRYELSF
ncbi:MAG: hypothetical protein AAF620_04540 [Bacteroidota bacterium]